MRALQASNADIVVVCSYPLSSVNMVQAIKEANYKPKLIGLTARQYTGWLEGGDDRALYAPHTETGFVAPPNKTLLLFFNGLQAKKGVRKARRAGALPAA